MFRYPEYIRKADYNDCVKLSQNLRDADKVELEALDKNPFQALIQSLAFSDVTFTLVDPNDETNPAAMLGVGPGLYHGSGVVWLLGSPVIDTHGWKFLRGSKEILDHLFKISPNYLSLYNCVHSENLVHINWLRWLGFKFIREVYTSHNTKFYEFVKLKDIQ